MKLPWLWRKAEVADSFREAEVKTSNQFFSLTDTQYGTSASLYGPTITAALSWLEINITEARLTYLIEDSAGMVEAALPAPLTFSPANTNLSLSDKVAGTAQDLLLYGNSIWLKLRNRKGEVIGFQFYQWSDCQVNLSADSLSIESYTLGHSTVSPRDVVHFRKGLSPSNPFLGRSNWDALADLNSADIQAAQYTNNLVKCPVPAFILKSKDPKSIISQEALDRLATRITGSTSGRNNGQIATLDADFEVVPVGFSPNDLNIETISNNLEEKICAILGIRVIVLGLGDGASPTYSNYSSAQKDVTNNLLVPIWNTIANALSSQCPELLTIPDSQLVFAYREIAALSTVLKEQSVTAEKLYRGQIINRAQALAMLGFEPKPEDAETYYKGSIKQNGS